MTHRTELFEILDDAGFEATQDGSRAYEVWFDRGPVRVVMTGMHPEELDEVLVYKFTDDAAQVLTWSVSFTGNTPTIVIAAAVAAAVDDPDAWPVAPRTSFQEEK